MPHTPLAAAFGAATFAALGLAAPAMAANVLATDAFSDCTVSEVEFLGWIDQAALGARPDRLPFTPADSYGAFSTPCDFYKWGAQMFLWLTSPTGGADTKMVLDGPLFWDALPTGADTFGLFPKSAPVPAPRVQQLIKADELITQGGIGKPDALPYVLLDQQWNPVYTGRHVSGTFAAMAHGNRAPSSPMFTFTTTLNGTDVTGVFPTTPEDVAAVVTYGTEQTDLIPADHAQAALAAGTMELKTSWVLYDDLPDALKGTVLTAEAGVLRYSPTRDSSGAVTQLAAESAPEIARLALVGMHIAAPVAGHPEMVWITFEHAATAPMAGYFYAAAADGTASDLYQSASDGPWIFNSGAPVQMPPAAVAPTAVLSQSAVVPVQGAAALVPPEVTQKNPWGRAAGDASPDTLTSNADLIALNASLGANLTLTDDLRRNYLQIGGIWTDGTLPASGASPTIQGGTRLANATMETFHQAPDAPGTFSQATLNCFSCHAAPTSASRTSVSHLFAKIAAGLAAAR